MKKDAIEDLMEKERERMMAQLPQGAERNLNAIRNRKRGEHVRL